MISRDQAIELIRKYIKTENTVKHVLATEAIMRVLAKRFEPEKEEEWAMAGLLHDIDYEQFSESERNEHGNKMVGIFKKEKVDLPDSVIQTMKAHCVETHSEWAPKNKMDWSLFICDSLTGLIVATTLVRPEKKLALVKLKSIKKKFKQPSFAAGTRRKDIKLCEDKLEIPLDEFIELSLKAMQEIAEDLGL